jgi:hypothetical protein
VGHRQLVGNRWVAHAPSTGRTRAGRQRPTRNLRAAHAPAIRRADRARCVTTATTKGNGRRRASTGPRALEHWAATRRSNELTVVDRGEKALSG